MPIFLQVGAPAQVIPVKLDPVSLVLHASGPVFFVVWSLVLAAIAVWVIAVMKLLQVARLRAAEDRFQSEASHALDAAALFALARKHGEAPGARVVMELSKRSGSG